MDEQETRFKGTKVLAIAAGDARSRTCALYELLERGHHWVAFGVWPLMVCPVSQGHTSSGVQVHGHEAEQVLGGVAHEL